MRRTLLILGALGLAVALVAPFAPTGAQDVLRTPVGQLGGRVPLGTEAPAGSEPGTTPTPDDARFVGAWVVRFGDGTEPELVELAADGTVRQTALLDTTNAVPARGAWVASGRSAAFSTVRLRVEPAGFGGTVLVSGTLTLGADGATVRGAFTELTVDAAGGVTGQERGDLTGSRA